MFGAARAYGHDGWALPAVRSESEDLPDDENRNATLRGRQCDSGEESLADLGEPEFDKAWAYKGAEVRWVRAAGAPAPSLRFLARTLAKAKSTVPTSTSRDHLGAEVGTGFSPFGSASRIPFHQVRMSGGCGGEGADAEDSGRVE